MGRSSDNANGLLSAMLAVFVAYLIVQFLGGFKIHWIMLVPTLLCLRWVFAIIHS